MGTILLADDSLTIQKVVELTFADTQHEVVATSSGDDLLKKLPDVRPDLVICDVIMPGSDGYDVCQRIKSSPASLHIPVVLLTGTFEPFDRDRALAAGCSEIITKPFEARRLVDTVERLLSQGAAAAPTPEAAAGDVDTFEGQVVPPPAPRAEDFGTRLAPPPAGSSDEDAMDFTATGFSEMEAAAVEEGVVEAPSEGLEFEIGEMSLATYGGDDGGYVAEAGEVEQAFEGPEPTYDTDEQLSGAADTGYAEPEMDSGEEAAEPEVEPSSDDLDSSWSAADGEELGVADTTPVVAPPVAPPPMTAPPVAPPPMTVPPVAPPPPASLAAPTAVLSDDDVERIARRVLELASDRLEQIAWEVIPDMAEIVVRERVRELEAEVESSSSDQVQ